MNSFQTLLNDPLVESIGWALMHFLWQGAAIAAITAAILLMLRRGSSNVKYSVCCLGLLLMTMTPVVTAVWMYSGDGTSATSRDTGGSVTSIPSDQTVVDNGSPRDASTSPPNERPLKSESPVVPDESQAHTVGRGQREAHRFEALAIASWLQPRLSSFLTAWLAGVTLLSARLLLCWLNVGRLSRRGTSHVGDAIALMFADLLKRVGVSRPVQLLESSLVQVPTVLGALRPVILLPATALTGLSTTQLQAILAHELAHVRRHDYLVNLLQTGVETLLFYHPAVWWVSRRIRQERENCCDDVASSVCGDRIEYAQALVRMEEIRGSAPQLAVASTGGSLMQRVKRLVASPVKPPHEGRRGWWLGGAIPIALLLLAASCIPQQKDSAGKTDDGAEDVYVVVWGAVVDQPLADRLLQDAAAFDTKDGWDLHNANADSLRGMLHSAAGSDEVIRLYNHMNWIAPLAVYMPEENLTGTLTNSDNVQFREPGNRAHILFTQNVIGQHRVLPESDQVRLRLKTRHNVRFEAFNTANGDAVSEHRGEVELDHRIANGDALIVTRALKPMLDWSPVAITVFEPVRIPAPQSRQRQIHDLPTWLAVGPDGIRQRSKAASVWGADATEQPVLLDGRWSRLLKNGSRVTLVGLSSPKNCPTAWWTPDGQPLAFDPLVDVQRQDLVALLHVIHSPDVAQSEESVSLSELVNPTSSLMAEGAVYLSGSERKEMSAPANGQLVVVSVDLKEQPSITLGLSTGTESLDEIGIVTAEESLVLAEGEYRAGHVFEQRHHNGDMTQISLTFPWNRSRQVVVTAVTKDGNTLESQFRPHVFADRGQATTGSVYDRFPVSLDEVSHFQLTATPMEWVSFAGFSRLPAALQELLTAEVKPPAVGQDAAMALVGWTFQGNAKALADMTAGTKLQSLGKDLNWFDADAGSLRKKYLKLREAGDADPPAPHVGWLYDFDQYMHVLGASVYRGPPTDQYPFGYSTGILAPADRGTVQAGTWTLEAQVKAISGKSRAWQIDGRWLVQDDNSTPEKGSQWADVFDHKLKLESELLPGRVAVFTGPTPGLNTDRTGFVVLECVPVPRNQIRSSRSGETSIEQLLRFGPARTLMLAGTVDTPEIEVAPNEEAAGAEDVAETQESTKTSDTKEVTIPSVSVTVRGRVLDDETGEPITTFITQAGKFNPRTPKKVQWGFSEGTSTAARKGRFSTTVRWRDGWTSRILADGYVPQPVITKAPKEGQTLIEVELRLKRGRWVRGKVVDHEGKPAEGVSVYALGQRGINLAGGRALSTIGGNDDSRVRAVTDASGRFEMTVGEAKRLAVSSPKIDAWPGELGEGMKETVIKLPDPGRVIVNFDIEGAGETGKVFWQFLGHSTPGFEGITSEQTREVKNGERLVLASLPPGRFQIGRSRMLRTGQMGMGRFLDRQWFRVKPGETITIDFTRPEGARVKGHVVGLRETTVKTALVTVTPLKEPENPEAEFEGWLTLDGQGTDENGDFTTERLPPGQYRFRAEVYLPLTPEQRFRSGFPTPAFTGETIVLVAESGEVPDAMIELKAREE